MDVFVAYQWRLPSFRHVTMIACHKEHGTPGHGPSKFPGPPDFGGQKAMHQDGSLEPMATFHAEPLRESHGAIPSF